MRLEVWSDVICPWCYIGKRRLEKALSLFEHRDEVAVLWRSFELDPEAARSYPGTASERLASKYGVSLTEADAMQARVAGFAAQEGLAYRLDISRPANTLDAHRLIHFAKQRGLQGEMKERLMKAYFTEGEDIGDAETLARLAAETGILAEEALAVLKAGDYAEAVRADEELAGRLGIRGVPFFLGAGKYGISGAQPAETLLALLEKAWEEGPEQPAD